MKTDEIISRCYEHGQPDYVLAADRLKELQAECKSLRDDKVREVLRLVLKEHWIMSVNCDKRVHTNRASCSCSVWVGHQVTSIGAAVDEWVEHVLTALAVPPQSEGERK